MTRAVEMLCSCISLQTENTSVGYVRAKAGVLNLFFLRGPPKSKKIAASLVGKLKASA